MDGAQKQGQSEALHPKTAFKKMLNFVLFVRKMSDCRVYNPHTQRRCQSNSQNLPLSMPEFTPLSFWCVISHLPALNLHKVAF